MLTFLFLYGLILVFDRKRDDLDAFTVATAAFVPAVLVFLFRMAAGYLEFGAWAAFAELGLLIVATYLVLTLNLGFKAGRAAAYTGAVFALNIAASFGFLYLSGSV